MPTPPTYSVGQVVGASDANTWFTPRSLVAASSFASVSTTLVSGPSVAVDASAYYKFECYLIYDGITGVDIKFQFTGPASSVLNMQYRYQATGTGTFTDSALTGLSTLGTAQAGGSGVNRMIAMLGSFTTGVTSGTLLLQFAENASSATPTHIQAGTVLSLTRQG